MASNSAYLNQRSTTGTARRARDVTPVSGICPICIKECPFVCEVSLSAFRGREALYPDPDYFGYSTAASVKDYGLDWSHFNIQASVTEIEGIEADPDRALFPNVSVETSIGGTPVKLPIIIGAFGSTDVAKNHWDSLAVGAATTGIMIAIGENVCGVDPESTITQGKVVRSPELDRRIRTFRNFWDGKYGDVIVQTNVEDQRLGVDVYAISKLEVNIIERKWGQGAKAIGGEIRVKTLERALALKKRGYLVLPDPEDKIVQDAFKQGLIHSFERHSRVGIPTRRDFLEDIDWLRAQGAKRIGLKTGAYRPTDVAFTMKVASQAKLNYLSFDGAGGGTGMSPVPMMDDMSIPTVNLEAMVLTCANILKKKGRYVPDLVMAGGFIVESQIFKAIALSNFGEKPLVKGVLMGRSPLTAAMKATYFAELSAQGKLPKGFQEKYGSKPESFSSSVPELKATYKERFKEIPWGAVGLYSYLNGRVKIGLQQLMAGARKWKLDLISRRELMSLTERATKVTGIPLVEDVDREAMEKILSD